MVTVLSVSLANAAAYNTRLQVGAIVIPIGVLVMVAIYVLRRRSGRR